MLFEGYRSSRTYLRWHFHKRRVREIHSNTTCIFKRIAEKIFHPREDVMGKQCKYIWSIWMFRTVQFSKMLHNYTVHVVQISWELRNSISIYRYCRSGCFYVTKKISKGRGGIADGRWSRNSPRLIEIDICIIQLQFIPSVIKS